MSRSGAAAVLVRCGAARRAPAVVERVGCRAAGRRILDRGAAVQNGGTNADLGALAEGLSEEIVTGLSRFSYLRVIARGSTARYVNEAVDVRTVGTEIGARYVMEGSLRQAGSQLRVAVQLVDATTGAHLWAETYDRPFQPEAISRCRTSCSAHRLDVADSWRARAQHERRRPRASRPNSDAVRSGHARLRLPRSAVADRARAGARGARARGRAGTRPRRLLGDAVVLLLARVRHGFNPRPDSLDRALAAARRAVDIAPSNHLAHQALARRCSSEGDCRPAGTPPNGRLPSTRWTAQR